MPPGSNGTEGGGDAAAEGGLMGLGGLASFLGVCMLLCFIGMMGCGLVTTVWQLTRRTVPLASYLSLIVPLSASEMRSLGLGRPAAAVAASETWRRSARAVSAAAALQQRQARPQPNPEPEPCQPEPEPEPSEPSDP